MKRGMGTVVGTLVLGVLATSLLQSCGKTQTAVNETQTNIAKSTGAATSTIPKGLSRSITIALEEKYIEVGDSVVKVEGRVSCLSTTGVVQYSTWIKTDYLEETTGAQKEREETFDGTDKSFYEVAPHTDGFLMAMLGAADLQQGSVATWKGTGVVLVYATPRGQSGIDKRISNVVRVAVDFDKHKASILQDIP